MIGIAAGVLVVTGAGLGAILGSRSDAPAATPAEAVEDSPPPGEDETQVPARDQPPPEEPVAAAAPPRETARPTAGQTATPPPALDQVRLPTVDPSRITTPEVRVPAAAQPPAQQGAEPPPLPTITVDPNALGAAPQAATLQITDPVPGLIVLINGERVQLDSGQVQLPPGEYTVTLSAPGYVSRTRTYTLAAGSMRALPGALRRQ